jgi:hypothetical protein
VKAAKEAKKATKKAAKKKQPPKPGTTAVKDRVIGMPLGREAQMLAKFLRGGGANPDLVPDLRNDAARSEWTAARGRYAKRVPAWLLDLTVAVLEQVPARSLRKAGKPKQDAVKDVEFLARAMPVAAAALMVATLEARRAEDTSDDNIQKRAGDLGRQVYRQPKTGMP